MRAEVIVFWLRLSSGCPVFISGLHLLRLEDLLRMLFDAFAASVSFRIEPQFYRGATLLYEARPWLQGWLYMVCVPSWWVVQDWPCDLTLSSRMRRCVGWALPGKVASYLETGEAVVFLLALGAVGMRHPPLLQLSHCQPEGEESGFLSYSSAVESTIPKACPSIGCSFVWDESFFIGEDRMSCPEKQTRGETPVYFYTPWTIGKKEGLPWCWAVTDLGLAMERFHLMSLLWSLAIGSLHNYLG